MADRSVVLRIRADIADAKRKLGELGDVARANAASASKSSQDWDKLGNRAAAAGVVAAGGLALVTKQAIDWESAWAGVNKTVDGTPAQMAELEAGLRELATTLPSTHSEIAAVAEAAGQLGVKQKDILGFTKTMIDLGQSTNLSADEAATAIAQISNVMGTLEREGAGGVARFGATLVELGNNGASTERDIVEMASRIAGAGKVVGLTEPELLAVSNALASVGIEAEAGGTAVSKVLIDMSKAISSGSEDLGKFAQVAGMSSEAFSQLFADSPAEALAAFTTGLGRMQTQGQDVFSTLDALGQSDIRVSSALLKMAGSGDLLTESLRMGNEAWEKNTALTDEATKRYETNASKIAVARNKVADASIDLGGAIAPMVTEAAEAVGSLARGFADLGEETQGNIATLGLAATGVLLVGAAAIKTTTSLVAFRAATVAADGSLTGMGKAATIAAKGLGVLAVAAGAVAIRQYIGESQVATVATDELADSISNLGKGRKAGGALGDLFKNSREEFVSMSEVVERFQETSKGAFLGFGDGLEGIDSALGRLQDGGQLMAGFEKQVGSLDAALAQMVSEGRGAEAEQFFNQLLDGMDPAVVDEVKAKFELYGGAVEAASQKAAAATGPAAEMSAALGENATKAEQAAYTVNEYVEALDGLRNPQLNAREAELAVLDAMDGVTKALEDNGKALNKNKTDFDLTTEAGRANRRALDDVASALGDQIGVMAEAGASQGELDAKLRTSRDELYQTARRMGLSKEAARLYVEQVLKIPPAKSTVVTVSLPTAQVEAFQRILNGLQGKDVRIGVRYNAGTLDNGGRDLTGGLLKAGGGPVYGPGSGTSDSIDARLSNGEHVWTAAEVDAAGGQGEVTRLRWLAKSGQLRFAAGGAVGSPGGFVDFSRLPAVAMGGRGVARQVIHHNPVNVARMEVADYTDFRSQEDRERALYNVGGGL